MPYDPIRQVFTSGPGPASSGSNTGTGTSVLGNPNDYRPSTPLKLPGTTRMNLDSVSDIETLHQIYRDNPDPQTRADAAAKLQKLTGLDSIVGRSVDEIKIAANAKAASDKYTAAGQTAKGKILDYAKTFDTKASASRSALASSMDTANQKILGDYTAALDKEGKQAMDLAQPGILENLNSRGFLSSQSAVAAAEAQAQKELAAQNQGALGDLTANLGIGERDTLTGFDNNIFGQENDLQSSALSAELGGDANAAESVISGGNSGLERAFSISDLAARNAQANALAKRQSRNGLTNALIGAGGSILGSAVAGPIGGALGGYLRNSLLRTQPSGGGYNLTSMNNY